MRFILNKILYFYKMKLSKIDINFIDCDLSDVIDKNNKNNKNSENMNQANKQENLINTIDNDLISLLPSFTAVLKSDYNFLNEYAKTKYVYKNTTMQTSLMLACYINDLKAVEILISKEIGYVDLYDNSALYYAKHSENNDIIELIKQYEFTE